MGDRGEAVTTYLRSEDLLAEPIRAERPPAGGLGRRRQIEVVVAVVGLALLTLGLENLKDTLSLEVQVLLYLLAVVIVAVVGGMVVALSSAIAAAF